jgi:hypothetical protein
VNLMYPCSIRLASAFFNQIPFGAYVVYNKVISMSNLEKDRGFYPFKLMEVRYAFQSGSHKRQNPDE